MIDIELINMPHHNFTKQLSIAKQRVSTAPRETVIEYADSSSDLLEACTAEYRFMAQKADEHAADAERLIMMWPEKALE